MKDSVLHLLPPSPECSIMSFGCLMSQLSSDILSTISTERAKLDFDSMLQGLLIIQQSLTSWVLQV